MKRKFFKYHGGKLPAPLFFPDATRAVVKTLDSVDIEGTQTPGILVNTFHLWQGLNRQALEKSGTIAKFMGWAGATVSDSGGFQVMSLIKSGKIAGKIADEGIVFAPAKNKRVVFGPQTSIRFQMELATDMAVVLDDFTDPKATYEEAKISVERTLDWAKRSKAEFEKICQAKHLSKEERPYLLGVVQGGEFLDLRKYCTQELVKIGFDGLGWGGWPFVDGKINFASARVIAENSPEDYWLHGLGIGRPEDIVHCAKLGFNLFDCVIPTREARHGKLFVFDDKFYTLFEPNKEKYLNDFTKVSTTCDCLLCRRYTRAYLAHLFKVGDATALRLSSIHNLRFYSQLMGKLRDGY